MPNDLVIHIDSRCEGAQQPASCGLVVVDAAAARPVHQAGYFLGPVPLVEVAAYRALLRALELVLPMKPESVDLRCTSELLVQQMTGVYPVSGEAERLCDEVQGHLLKLDTWRIASDVPEDATGATELARRALEDEQDLIALSAEDSPRRHHRDYTGVPQWTVELLEDPGPDCPAKCAAGIRYPFGPDLPAGFCVHAAREALNDGPLTWIDLSQRSMTTVCPHCEVPMRIKLVE